MKEERGRGVLSIHRRVNCPTWESKNRGEWWAMKTSSEVRKGWQCLGRVAGESASSGNSQGFGGGQAVGPEVRVEGLVRGPAQGVWERLPVSYQDKTQDRDDGLGAVTSPVTVCGSSALSFRPLRRRVDLLFEFPPLGGFSFR